MAITDICILIGYPFSKRDYDWLGVELLSRNFRVSVLDCTPWLTPDIWHKYAEIAFRCPGYKPVVDLKVLVEHIKSPSKTVAIDVLGFCSTSRRIRAELKILNVRRAVVQIGLVPDAEILPKKIQRFFSKTPAAMMKSIRWRCERLLRREPTPEIALMSGIAGLKDSRVRGAKHKIWAHSCDYDTYLDYKGQAATAVEPYAVFLDQDVVYHSDSDYLGMELRTTAKNYYASINSYFKKFESDAGIPIVVAVHPRSRHDLRPDLWQGRAAIVGKTAQLVRDATLVFCHDTTAVSFAVLWRKPVVVLTTDDLVQSAEGHTIALWSAALGAPLVNVDRNISQLPSLQVLCDVNESVYAKYTEDYIKRPGTPAAPIWQIFSEYVQQEFV